MAEIVPQLTRFDYDDTWQVGSELYEHARSSGLAVTIGIWLGEQLVFHAARPGTSADQDSWLRRKAAIVRRFRAPSLEVAQRHVDPDEGGLDAFLTTFALPTADYAPAGGAVPVVVHGHLVGVVAVSGLASEVDHELAVGALTRLAERQRSS